MCIRDRRHPAGIKAPWSQVNPDHHAVPGVPQRGASFVPGQAARHADSDCQTQPANDAVQPSRIQAGLAANIVNWAAISAGNVNLACGAVSCVSVCPIRAFGNVAESKQKHQKGRFARKAPLFDFARVLGTFQNRPFRPLGKQFTP